MREQPVYSIVICDQISASVSQLPIYHCDPIAALIYPVFVYNKHADVHLMKVRRHFPVSELAGRIKKIMMMCPLGICQRMTF